MYEKVLELIKTGEKYAPQLYKGYEEQKKVEKRAFLYGKYGYIVGILGIVVGIIGIIIGVVL